MVAELEAELETPPFPIEIAYLWKAWSRLRRRKRSGPDGIAPLEWPDFDAYSRLAGQHLSPIDIELIEAIDDAYLASFAAGPSPSEEKLALKDGVQSFARRGNPELTDGHCKVGPGGR